MHFFSDFKYNIDLYLIHKLFLTIHKRVDQKALLDFISTHFLKARLLLFFFFLNSVQYSVLFYCSEILASQAKAPMHPEGQEAAGV